MIANACQLISAIVTLMSQWAIVQLTSSYSCLQAARFQQTVAAGKTAGQAAYRSHRLPRHSGHRAAHCTGSISLPSGRQRGPFRGRSMRHIRNKRHNNTYGAARRLSATPGKNTATSAAPRWARAAAAQSRWRGVIPEGRPRKEGRGG